MKPSEVIKNALNHPCYFVNGGDVKYLCYVISVDAYDAAGFETREVARRCIGCSIECIAPDGLGVAYLWEYLQTTGKITNRDDPRLVDATIEHWETLINKLESEGM